MSSQKSSVYFVEGLRILMAFRDIRFVEYCIVCGRKAKTACKRCGVPLCNGHKHVRASRCDQCEADFDARLAKISEQGDNSLTDQNHARFGKTLVISAGAGLVGLLGLLVSSAIFDVGAILTIAFALTFFFGTLACIVLIPTLWFQASSGGHTASFTSAIRAWLVQSGARRDFLHECKQDFLADRADDAG